MLLVVVGNVERAQVESLVTATIGQLPRGEYKWTLPPPVHPQRSRWLVEYRVLPTNYILGYFAGPAASSDEYAAFHVATDLLSSLLFESIRVKKGLSYAAYAPFQERAIAVGGLYASSPKPEEVLPLMVQQVRFLLSTRINRLGLSRYIDTYVLKSLQQSETDAAQADLLARAELYLGDYRKTDRFLRQLHKVGPDDVFHAANRYMLKPQWAFLGDTMRMIGKW
jgi:zinc protease